MVVDGCLWTNLKFMSPKSQKQKSFYTFWYIYIETGLYLKMPLPGGYGFSSPHTPNWFFPWWRIDHPTWVKQQSLPTSCCWLRTLLHNKSFMSAFPPRSKSPLDSPLHFLLKTSLIVLALPCFLPRYFFVLFYGHRMVARTQRHSIVCV